MLTVGASINVVRPNSATSVNIVKELKEISWACASMDASRTATAETVESVRTERVLKGVVTMMRAPKGTPASTISALTVARVKMALDVRVGKFAIV